MPCRGQSFVVSAIEVPPRERLWRSDWEIPLRHGVRQPYAENGGPGGFAHAARNIGPVLKIAHDMEAACPDAWFINYTNPMVRICDAIHRYSRIKAIGLCHQIYAGYGLVGYLLADKLGLPLPQAGSHFHDYSHLAAQVIDIKAAGLNHFTWMLDVRDQRTGEDLYPLVRERWAKADPRLPALDPPDAGCLRLDAHPGRWAPVRIPALGERPIYQALGKIQPAPV